MPAGSNGAIFAVGLYLTFSVSLPRSVALGPASSITNSARTARTAAQHATSDMHSADTADAADVTEPAADALFPICAFFLFLSFHTNYVVVITTKFKPGL